MEPLIDGIEESSNPSQPHHKDKVQGQRKQPGHEGQMIRRKQEGTEYVGPRFGKGTLGPQERKTAEVPFFEEGVDEDDVQCDAEENQGTSFKVLPQDAFKKGGIKIGHHPAHDHHQHRHFDPGQSDQSPNHGSVQSGKRGLRPVGVLS